MFEGSLLIIGLAIISVFITVGAQVFIKNSYARYSKVTAKKGLTGYDTARLILDKNGLKEDDLKRYGDKIHKMGILLYKWILTQKKNIWKY